MSVSFDCRFSIVGSVPPSLLPPRPINIPSGGTATSLHDLFFFSSGGTIDLQPNYGFLANGYDTNLTRVPAENLHRALADLTQNSPGAYPVPRLGVLFSSVYAPRDNVFGIMFDTGFTDPDAPIADVSTSPRQGCVVFLQTIQQLRPDPADYQNQVAFDLAHELGHVFNLQHVTDAPCFLNVSSLDETPPVTAFAFLSLQRTILAECGVDRAYTPGGDPFGSGDLGNEDRPRRPTQRPKGLELKIGMTQKEFWPWEPVELDIALRKTDRNRSRVSVPDRIDPGYSNFEVWIEEPTGERRRYKPTKHYCAYEQQMSLTRSRSYRRDLSVFAEAGGYTFKQPGSHRIWATFRVSKSQALCSNSVTVFVKSQHLPDKRARRRLDETRRLAQIAGRSFYYRTGRISGREEAALNKLIQRNRNEYIGSSAEYTLGRIYFDRMKRSPGKRSAWRSKAQFYLESACQRTTLGEHRNGRAAELVGSLRAFE